MFSGHLNEETILWVHHPFNTYHCHEQHAVSAGQHHLLHTWLHTLLTFSCSSYHKGTSCSCSIFCHLIMQRAILSIYHLQDFAFLQTTGRIPLCGFYSLADVQAVTLHFIIIGRSHLRERESMARALGSGRERQTGWLGGFVGRRRVGRRSSLESEDRGGRGEGDTEERKKERKPLANIKTGPAWRLGRQLADQMV